MKFYRSNISRFCDLIKFPKVSKDIISLQRLDKISIFEYFELVEEKKIAKSHDILIKEIADYIYSPVFDNEFKLTLINDEKKFKFFLMNISLIAHRVKKTIEEENLNLLTYLKCLVYGNNNQNYYLDRMKIIYFIQFIPLKFFSKENLKFYISKNQISKYYENNNVIEEEFIKKYTKIDFSFLKLKRQFINDLDKIDNEDDFKTKYITNFLLKSNDNKINENEADKLLLYFIAHV